METKCERERDREGGGKEEGREREKERREGKREEGGRKGEGEKGGSAIISPTITGILKTSIVRKCIFLYTAETNKIVAPEITPADVCLQTGLLVKTIKGILKSSVLLLIFLV